MATIKDVRRAWDDLPTDSREVAYQYFWICDHCAEPTKTLDMCSYLGHNPGVSGHMFVNEEAARNAWDRFIADVRKHGSKRSVAFQSRQEEVAFLRANISLFKVGLFAVQTQETQ